MKELIEYSEKDKEMLDELEKAIDILSAASNKVDERFLGIAELWRNHRQQLIKEQTEEEWDKNDSFYSKLWDLRNNLKNVSHAANRLKNDIDFIRKGKSPVFVHP